MSSRESEPETTNPYQAPSSAPLEFVKSGRRPNIRGVALWVLGGIVVQSIGVAAVVLIAERGGLGLARPLLPTLHVIATVVAVVIVSFRFQRQNGGHSATVFAQLLNATQWGTLVLTIKLLPYLVYTDVGLSPLDKKVFFGIFCAMAMVLGVVSYLMRRHQQSSS